MQNILPVLCFIAGFALAWLVLRGRHTAREAELEARLDSERRAASDKIALIEDSRVRLGDSFAALSAAALARNNEAFLQLATSTFARSQDATRGDVAAIVSPVRESLDKVDHKIQELEKARAGAYAALNEQVRSLVDTQSQLRSETGRLVTAPRLASP